MSTACSGSRALDVAWVFLATVAFMSFVAVFAMLLLLAAAIQLGGAP